MSDNVPGTTPPPVPAPAPVVPSVHLEVPEALVSALQEMKRRPPERRIDAIQPYLAVAFVLIAAMWTVFQFVLFNRVQTKLDIESKMLEITRQKQRSLGVEHTITTPRITDIAHVSASGATYDYLITFQLTLHNNTGTPVRVSKTTTQLWTGTEQETRATVAAGSSSAIASGAGDMPGVATPGRRSGDTVGSADRADDTDAPPVEPIARPLNAPLETGAIVWKKAVPAREYELVTDESAGGGTAVLYPGEASVYIGSYLVSASDKTWVGVEIDIQTDKTKQPIISTRAAYLGQSSPMLGTTGSMNVLDLVGGMDTTKG